MKLEIDLDMLAAEDATRGGEHLAERGASQAPSPWIALDEAIACARNGAGVVVSRLLLRVDCGSVALRGWRSRTPRPKG